MIKKKICIACCALFLCFAGYAQEKTEPVTIGQKHILNSEVLGQERPVLVNLPDNYDKSEASYPVMYLLDGRGNFHHTTATVKFLSRHKRIPEMIVIGIPNTDDRTRDLTPSTKSGKESFPTAGGADKLIQFMQEELFPWVNENYRTEDYKLLVGHSFGGLFAVHTLIHHPGVFNSYLAISPSLWWDQQDLVLNQSEGFFENQKELTGHLYMTMGNEGNEMLGGTWKLAAMLEEKGPRNLHWDFNIMKEETHGSIPYRSTYKGLEFIFDQWNMNKWDDQFNAGGIDAINDYQETVEQLYGLTPKWQERKLVGLGQSMLENENVQKALPVLKKSTSLFPKSEKAWYYYGRSLATTGQKKEAIASFNHLLELNPENLQALVSLRRLGEKGSKKLPNIKLSPKDLEAYVGSYKMDIGVMVDITSDGKQLRAESEPVLPNVVLDVIGENRFFILTHDSTLQFEETDGKISGISAITPDGTYHGTKKTD